MEKRIIKAKKNSISKKYSKPMILAPAGNRASFFAALAAGADAIYCGLKEFSARSEAKNFNIDELSKLTMLAKSRNVKIYIAINAMLKPNEILKAQKIVRMIRDNVNPDAMIVQDLGFIRLIHESGYIGQIHLSTLANVSFPRALTFVRDTFNISCVVIPRELSLSEIKIMSKACPNTLGLELFVHGAMCYAISGRCYWSSYLGGKSSLRGNCVQPCRRLYSHKGISARVFSCYDLSLDAHAKVTKNIPQIHAWKIEGRKKGPHYVYSTVSAYKMLRDCNRNKEMHHEAKKILKNCLGRKGTYCNFLPQKPQNPISTEKHTSSGMYLGKIKYRCHKVFFSSKISLLPRDVLRIGYENETLHHIVNVNCYIAAGENFYLNFKKDNYALVDAPVFLKDRKEKFLVKLIEKIGEDAESISHIYKKSSIDNSNYKIVKFRGKKKVSERKKAIISNMNVTRKVLKPNIKELSGVWLYDNILQDIETIDKKKLWIWLPPVIWPKSELKIYNLLIQTLKIGIRNFILNMPWQLAFFKNSRKLSLWAGPFCNISNMKSLEVLKNVGFQGAIVSPELSFYDYIHLANGSPILLGIVISGNWPLSISRHVSDKINLNYPFRSPKKERGWVAKYGNDYWTFPDWKLDIMKQKNRLLKSGYSMFINLIEPIPPNIKMKKRLGLWNSRIGLI